MVTVQWQTWWECSHYLSAATAILVAVAGRGSGRGGGKVTFLFERASHLSHMWPWWLSGESVELLSHLGPGLGVPLSAHSILGQLWFMAYKC